MKRNGMLTLSAFGAAVLVWSSVCYADPATVEAPRTAGGNAETKCCPWIQKNKGGTGEHRGGVLLRTTRLNRGLYLVEHCREYEKAVPS